MCTSVEGIQKVFPVAGLCEFTCDHPQCNQPCIRPRGHQGFCNCGRHTDLPIPTWQRHPLTVVKIWYCVNKTGCISPVPCGKAQQCLSAHQPMTMTPVQSVSCGLTHQGCGGHCMLPSRHLGEHYCGICEQSF